MARPGFPITLDTRLTFAFGVTAVAHSSSARERLNCALSSSGRTNGTEQVGLAAAKKSRLLAQESHDSILHAPASEISTVST